MGVTSSKQRFSGTVLEDLSNELLFELFDYFSSNEINLSFYHLNSRFDSLIVNYPKHINLELSTLIPRHIISLKIAAKYQLPYFFSLDSCQISSIRALTLANLQMQHLLKVLNAIELKQLEYVYLGVCNDDASKIEDFLKLVQMKILTLGECRLRRCHLRGQFLVNVDQLPATLPALKYLHLDGCRNLAVLSLLLSRTPNLKSLQVTISSSTPHPLHSVPSRITDLHIQPYTECSADIMKQFLLTCCPFLKSLVIDRSKLVVGGPDLNRRLSEILWDFLEVWSTLSALERRNLRV